MGAWCMWRWWRAAEPGWGPALTKHRPSTHSLPPSPPTHHPNIGIIKVVPPLTAAPAALTDVVTDRNGGDAAPVSIIDFRFSTRVQTVAAPVWDDLSAVGKFWDGATDMALSKFEEEARNAIRARYGTTDPPPAPTVEAAFWAEWSSRTRHDGRDAWTVQYGNDVEGSLFARAAATPPCPLAASDWNLRRLPHAPGSLLAGMQDEAAIPGVSCPMLYIGAMFASFGFHVEDAALYSINYAHRGAPKIWYGTGAQEADKFEAAVAERVYKAGLPSTLAARGRGGGAPSSSSAAPDRILPADRLITVRTLAAKTTLVSPGDLLAAGVPVYRVIHEPGTFVITFPRAYHGGFSAGVHIGEAVNFATDDWLPWGVDAADRYAARRERCMIDVERLVLRRAGALLDGAIQDVGPRAAAARASIQLAWGALVTRIQDRVTKLVTTHGVPRAAPAAARGVVAASSAAAPMLCARCVRQCAVASVTLAMSVADAERVATGGAGGAAPAADGATDVVCLDCALELVAAAPAALARTSRVTVLPAAMRLLEATSDAGRRDPLGLLTSARELASRITLPVEGLTPALGGRAKKAYGPGLAAALGGGGGGGGSGARVRVRTDREKETDSRRDRSVRRKTATTAEAKRAALEPAADAAASPARRRGRLARAEEATAAAAAAAPTPTSPTRPRTGRPPKRPADAPPASPARPTRTAALAAAAAASPQRPARAAAPAAPSPRSAALVSPSGRLSRAAAVVAAVAIAATAEPSESGRRAAPPLSPPACAAVPTAPRTARAPRPAPKPRGEVAPKPAPRAPACTARLAAVAAAEGPPPASPCCERTTRAAPAEPAPAPHPARGGDRSRAATLSRPASRRVSPASRESAAPRVGDASPLYSPVAVQILPANAAKMLDDVMGPVKVTLAPAFGAVVAPQSEPAAAPPPAPIVPTPPSVPHPDSRGAVTDDEADAAPAAPADAEAGPPPAPVEEEAATEPPAAAAAPPAPTTATADATAAPADAPIIEHTTSPALPGAVAVAPIPASECAAPASVRVPVWTPAAGSDHGTRYVALPQVADEAELNVGELAVLAGRAALVAAPNPGLTTGGALLKAATLTELARLLPPTHAAALAAAVEGVWPTNPVSAAAVVGERAAARVARVRTATVVEPPARERGGSAWPSSARERSGSARPAVFGPQLPPADAAAADDPPPAPPSLQAA